MKVCFVLPGSGQNPCGGFKVAYEYANGLVSRGHEVTVVHAPYNLYGGMSYARSAKKSLVYGGRLLGCKGGYLPDKWFLVDPRVVMKWVPSLHQRWISDADAVVATSWETAEWVANYPPDRGKKFYLIQHQESTFVGTDKERVDATWKLPLKKIVIARWLEAIAHSLGEDAAYIPNGLDFKTFGLDLPISGRNPARLIMLYHDQPWKGSNEGLAAMDLVKREIPELEAVLFGVPHCPAGLPGWVSYFQKPAQSVLRRLYNEAAIFVGPSWAEGWPLPPAEAMQCGAALCVTDIGGHQEYALAGKTALLSPPRSIQALANSILTLVRDQGNRIAIATGGNEFIAQFTWERAVNTFERFILDDSE